MDYEWDEVKAEINRLKHGVAFESIEAFRWEDALIEPDRRHDYGEPRFLALGYIGNRLHAVIFTLRHHRIRIIGLRKANAREQRRHEQKTQT